MRLLSTVVGLLAVGQIFATTEMEEGEDFPHAVNYNDDCNARQVASCTRRRWYIMMWRHYMIGVERYCPPPNSANATCWDWREQLGKDGSKLKDSLSDSWCLGTNFTFHSGYNNPEHEEIAPAGFFWSATIQTPYGCNAKAIRKRMDWAGIPHRRLLGDKVYGLKNNRHVRPYYYD
ncbi:hypothetical protein BT63DRAFT_470044 [Microthyrium microscopicum]|uniref:Ecp2 effector protein domain-containing protein n=1 Tax=Microthyrium microscopicum TaxID=703497 RepID=A0A6A6UF53_9PEZI|nr:hypothetical protein BT63DRAFT_470044 [Microthyrium microscopicum]